MSPQDASIRAAYQKHGTAAAFYKAAGTNYRNPHEDVLVDLVPRVCLPLDTSRVFDLAAGSGEVTMSLRAAGVTVAAACDPYAHAAYERRTGRPCAAWSFEQIAAGTLAGESFSLIVCSFALHLCLPSRLAGVCAALARAAPTLAVFTPHKKPEIKPAWGWRLREELLDRRVRGRVYERIE